MKVPVMSLDTPGFSSVPDMLRAMQPTQPVYCIYPGKYLHNTREFLKGFPGRVLYAVKVNDDPRVISLLYKAGVRHFDCASVPEIKLVSEICPDATCYFMIPVWLRGAAMEAWQEYGVKHFVVDHPDGLETLKAEIPLENCVVFVRMAVSHKSALNDLSTKFGAPPSQVPDLMQAVKDSGAEPALAFNVGSAVTDPEAYRYAIDVARQVLEQLNFKVRFLDIGGGYPVSYPGLDVPELRHYWDAVRESITALPLADGGEILTEPGRALAAPGLSAVVEVLQRKSNFLYINDGNYGIFWELRFKGHDRYPVTVFRDAQIHQGPTQPFTLFGPTCDAFDVLPGKVELPVDIKAGDYLEFSKIGAYSLAGRTNFNSHFSNNIVTINGDH
ncbi:MAG: ornithine decarboxylase [Lysobacterales bacterium]|jgi:ornithine decarboxylase